MQHPRDGSLLRAVGAPIAISPFVSEVCHHGPLASSCGRSSRLCTCLGPSAALAVAEVHARVASASVRNFTKTLLDMVVVTIECNFMMEKCGFDATPGDASSPRSATATLGPSAKLRRRSTDQRGTGSHSRGCESCRHDGPINDELQGGVRQARRGVWQLRIRKTRTFAHCRSAWTRLARAAA